MPIPPRKRKIATPTAPPLETPVEDADYQVPDRVRVKRDDPPDDRDIIEKYQTKWADRLEPLWLVEVRHAGLIRFYLLLSLADLLMTYTLLRMGGFQEANPIARWFLFGWGIKGMVYYKFILVGIVCGISQVVARKREDLGRFVLQLAICVTFCVVCYGMTLMYRRVMG